MIHEINIAIHVIIGSIALGIGIIPFITTKGSQKHRFYGKIFLALISISIITAFNGVLFFRDRPFLTVITLLALYQSISGYRAIKYKEKGPGYLDLALILIILGFAVSFLLKMHNSNIVWPKAIVHYTFAYLAIFLIYDLLRIFKIVRNRHLWLIEHIIKMTGAFSALFTAAMGNVLTSWEPYNQIISVSISNILLVTVIYFYYTRWRKTLLIKHP